MNIAEQCLMAMISALFIYSLVFELVARIGERRRAIDWDRHVDEAIEVAR